MQEAVNAAKSSSNQRIIIFIKNGTYDEKIRIPITKTNIYFLGESRENTILTHNDYSGKPNIGPNSTFNTYTLLVEGNDFIAENLTIQNTAGTIAQAVALNINADRVIVNNCSLLGNQDTLYTSGRGSKNYFINCYIEGTTDFIFGHATALFENCIIHSKKDSYITAAATPETSTFGYIFKNCKLTADENTTQVYLGRPWKEYAKTVFMNCEMGKHIKPEGWHNWSKPEAEKTVFYAEYKCKGLGFQPKKRVTWSHQLKKSEAKKYTLENCMGLEFSKAIIQYYSK
ncbi:pectinesterase family protein [Flavobacterium eburneipallidum]|uniref:pectinesterase family protein n=1 Tax=Flavobacterium eburneipallidum TaxID=3003263 RepID=UPI002482D847|nr:pectinesterase family protein [Flavobacterium eburneipallidum]